MSQISFMGANLVAQQLDWNQTQGWAQGDSAANLYYSPIETFEARFGAFLDLVRDAGFSSVDVWTAQLNWRWATEFHRGIAANALAVRGLTVTSYAGSFGASASEFRSAQKVAQSVGAPLLSGNASLLVSDRSAVVSLLRESGLRLAVENHPEKSAAELLPKIQDGAGGAIGAAVDTGWFATQGANPAEQIRELAPHLLHVHLKDIRVVGAHDTCALGDGIADIPACVDALIEMGYTGPISIEHEPETFDPVPDVIESARRLKGWLASSDA